MTENISIGYSPVAGGISNHAILFYTNNARRTVAIEAGPENRNLSFSDKVADVLSNNRYESSDLGRLIVAPQIHVLPDSRNSDGTLYSAYPTETLTFGDDLSRQWSQM